MGDATPAPVIPEPPPPDPRWRPLGIAAGVLVCAFAGLLAMAWPGNEGYFRQHKELDALLTLALFFVLGFAAITAVWELYPDLKSSKAVFGLFLVVPLLGFLVLTDRISSISGPGVSLAVNTTLTTSDVVVGQQLVAQAEGTPSTSAPECLGDQPAEFTVPQQAQPTQEGPQSGNGPTPTPPPTADAGANLGPTVYWRLTLSTCDYAAADLASQLQTIVATGAFRFVLLVYGGNHFFAYIPAADAVRLFETRPDELVEAINARPERLKDAELFPGIIFHTLSTEDTTLKALRIMRDQNLDTLPVVDDDGDLAGVATWNQVLTSMMLELVTTTSD
jgi:hypothetical protein